MIVLRPVLELVTMGRLGPVAGAFGVHARRAMHRARRGRRDGSTEREEPWRQENQNEEGGKPSQHRL